MDNLLYCRNVRFYPVTNPQFTPVSFDCLIDRRDLRRNFLMVGGLPLLAIKPASLARKYINFISQRFFQCAQLFFRINTVSHQQFGLFHISVKLDDLRHVIPPLPGRSFRVSPFPQQINIAVIQRPKAGHFSDSTANGFPLLPGRWRSVIRRCLLMLPYTLPYGFFGIAASQCFQPDKPLFSRRPDRYVLAGLDCIPLPFQVIQEVSEKK